jgi:hypothetical protein
MSNVRMHAHRKQRTTIGTSAAVAMFVPDPTMRLSSKFRDGDDRLSLRREFALLTIIVILHPRADGDGDDSSQKPDDAKDGCHHRLSHMNDRRGSKVHIHNKGNSTFSPQVKWTAGRQLIQSTINLISNEHHDCDKNGPSTNMKGRINRVNPASTGIATHNKTGATLAHTTQRTNAMTESTQVLPVVSETSSV